jgi:hypothetical protein
VQPKPRRVALWFALFALLGVAAVVLPGAVSGVAALLAMLVLIVACVQALRNEDADTRARSDRTGLAGWFGGWF